MQTMAKNQPVGYAFIYDLAHNIIRKYEVYWDSTCGPQQAPQVSSGNGANCGSFKAADEVTPVNPGVQNIFNSLHSTWLVNPTLANQARSEVQNFPLDGNGIPYDASKIAWDYPQGVYLSFYNYIRDHVLGSRANANAFSPGMGDFIFGVSVAVNSVDVGNPPQVLIVHVTFDRQIATVHLMVCNNSGDCVNFDIKVLDGAIDSVTYTGTFDSDNMMLPSQSGQTPGQLNSWHWQYGSDADHFAQMLNQRSGVQVPTRPGCGSSFHYGLTVARINGAIDSMTWQCIPN
jgi:hypothetical protein